MALPRKLKNLNLFNDGNNYMGIAQTFTPPKLSRKMDAYRGGGMGGSVNVDMGLDDSALDVAFTMGGVESTLLAQYATKTTDGVLLRFTGAYQRDDSGDVDAVEIVCRGRHKEIDWGEQKPGETSSVTVSMVCTYYKLTINGQDVIEIDLVNMIEKVNGVDLMAEQRKALGL